MAFLLDNELEDSLDASKRYSDDWMDSFGEYERLGSNQPSDQLPDKYPKFADGTSAGLIEEEPMRVWGKLQTGRVISSPLSSTDFKQWKTAVVDAYWSNKIIPNANTGAKFFEKCRLVDEKAATYGGQPVYVFPVSNEEYTGSDFMLPYIKDVKFEPGAVSDRSCSYLWLARHYTKLQLRGIIEAVKDIPGNVGWDVNALQKIVDSNAFDSRSEDLHRDQKTKTDMGKTVTFWTNFAKGYKSPWRTIYLDSGSNIENYIIRTQYNDDLAGDIPVFFRYHKINLINPYGVSRFDLIGPNQNMVDFLTSAQGYGVQKALDPPLEVHGPIDSETGIDLDSLDAGPDGIIFSGNNDINWFTPDKNMLTSFPSLIGPFKTSIMNLTGTNDGTVAGGDSGSSMYSKVPASIKQQEGRKDSRDNTQRQKADDFMETLARLLINTAVRNSDGSDAIDITEDQGDKLRAAGFDVPEGAKRIVAEFSELKGGSFKYIVDPGSSKLEEDDATKQRISEAIETAQSIQDLDDKLAKDHKEIHWGPLLAAYFDKSGIDNVDKVIVDLPEDEAQTEDNKEEVERMQMQQTFDQMKQQQEQEKVAQQQLKTQEQAAKTATATAASPMQQAQAGQPQSDDEMVKQRLLAEGWNEPDADAFIQNMRGAQNG